MVEVEEILYSYFQPPFSLTKMLQCVLSCESIEDIFDESTVKTYVKSDLGNSSWVIGSG